MEPRIIHEKINQYSVGEFGRFVDIDTHRMIEGVVHSVIDDVTGLSESVYLTIRTENGIISIKVA
jgi:hypothetical protein